jgi:hypothetical protein
MPAGVSAWTPLANVTLSSPATTVTFSSISAIYKDLRIVYVGNSNGYYGAAPSIRFNGDASNVYPTVLLTGDGSSVQNSTLNFAQIPINDANYMSPAVRMLCTVDIFDYSATDKHKSVLSRANQPSQGVNANTGRWPSTAAINSITVGVGWSSTAFVTGSTFALYGVSA